MKLLGLGILMFALTGGLVAQTPRRGGRPAQMDTNNDGKIAKDEWKGPVQGFTKLDTDGDGFITREEMRKKRFDRLDANQDGVLSRDEVQAARRK